MPSNSSSTTVSGKRTPDFPSRLPLKALILFFFVQAAVPVFAADGAAVPAVGSAQAVTAAGADQSWPWPERKDPFFAAALSWFVPGLGQLYVGRPLEGGVYWLVDNALFWGAVLNIAEVDFGLERDIGVRFAIRMRENLSSARIWTSVGLGLCYLAFHIYNVLDAADDAHAHNQRLLLREMKQEGLSFRIGPELTGVGYAIPF